MVRSRDALWLDWIWYIVGELACRYGGLSFGIFEDEGRVKPYVFEEPVGLGKVFLALPTEASNDIGAEDDVGLQGADTVDQSTTLVIGIGAIHQAKDAVTAGLKR